MPYSAPSDALLQKEATEAADRRSQMTGSLERIKKEFKEFHSLVDHCRNDATIAEIRNAYDCFYRLRERYLYEDEAGTLSPTEEAALKGFREDKFIESVDRMRGISAHVETGDVELLDPDNCPVYVHG